MTERKIIEPPSPPGIYINPGAGEVTGSTRENADANMAALMTDTEAEGFTFVREEDDGRFTYTLQLHGADRQIEMPGWPLNEVRYMEEPEQNIWDFPRLYVDGSSWVWCYALGVLKEET